MDTLGYLFIFIIYLFIIYFFVNLSIIIILSKQYYI